MSESVNVQAAAAWSDIAARDKIAFFAADVAIVGGEPMLTYTASMPDNGAAADEAWTLVRQKLAELAAAICDAVAPPLGGMRLTEVHPPSNADALPSLGELEAACLRLSRAAAFLAARAACPDTRSAPLPAQQPATQTQRATDARDDGRTPLVSYDPSTDLLTVEGVKYDADMFRSVASVFVPRTVLAIDRDAEGYLTVSVLSEPAPGATVVHACHAQALTIPATDAALLESRSFVTTLVRDVRPDGRSPLTAPPTE